MATKQKEVGKGGWVLPSPIVRLWDRQGRQLARLNHRNVDLLAFSQDGQDIVTVGSGEVRLWDLKGRELARLSYGDMVLWVHFTRNEILLTAASSEGIWLWHLRPEGIIAEACRLLPRNLTPEEWQQYLPQEPYRPTCKNLPPGEILAPAPPKHTPKRKAGFY